MRSGAPVGPVPQAAAAHAHVASVTGAPLGGILLFVAAIATLAVLDSLSKHLSQSYPVPMVVWARYLVHVVIMLAVLWPRMGRRLIATRRPGLQIARGLGLGLSTLFFVTGLSVMPLAEASAITLVTPILLTVLAVRVLREKAPSGTWWALAVSFCGVLLIVRPGGQVFGWAALFPLATAISFAGYQILTRKLAGVDEGLATLFIGALVAALLATLLVPWFWQLPRNWADAGLFVALGAVGALGHLLLVRAFERTPASLLAPFSYLQVVASLTLGLVLFGDFPDLLALAGMALIALTGMTMALRRRRGPQAADAGVERRTAAMAAPVLAPDGAPVSAIAVPPAGSAPASAPAPAHALAPIRALTPASAPAAVSGSAHSSASAAAGALPRASGPASGSTRAAAAASIPAVASAAISGAAPLRGIALAIGAYLLFALLDSLAKYLSQSHHPMMIAWARYVFHVVVMVAVLAPSMGRRLFLTRKPGLQVARGLCLGFSSVCFFTSISYLPLAEATAIVAISPVLVTAGAVWFLKERAPRRAWGSLALSFAGVLLIVRPGSTLFGWAALLPLLTAVFAVGYQLMTRQLSGVDNGLATLFIGGAVAALLLSLFAPNTWSLPTGPLDAVLLVATGVIGALGHLMLVRAYEAASAASLAPYGYMHAAAALVFGALFFGQFPDTLGLLGLGLIVTTGIMMALRSRAPATRR
jgi:drug/metabolite transporter (DMT)-like permease